MSADAAPTPRSLRLRQLLDVSSAAPTSGYVLLYNAATGRWEPKQVGTAGIADGAVTVAKLAADVDARYVNAAGDTMSGSLGLGAGAKIDFADEAKDDKVDLWGGAYLVGIRTNETRLAVPAAAHVKVDGGPLWVETTTSPHLDLFNPTNAVGTIAGIATRTGSGWHTRWGTVQGSWWHAFMDGANGVVWGYDGTDLKVGANKVIHEGNPSLLDGRFVNVTGDVMSGDLRVYRSAATGTGVLYFSQSGDIYLYYDGATFVFNGGPAYAVRFHAGDGSVSSPGLRFNNEATGLYRGAAGQVQLSRAGNEAWYAIHDGTWEKFGCKGRFAVEKEADFNPSATSLDPAVRVRTGIVGNRFIAFHNGTSDVGDIQFASGTAPEVAYRTFAGAHPAQIKRGVPEPPLWGLVISTGEIVPSQVVAYVERRLVALGDDEAVEAIEALRRVHGGIVRTERPSGYPDPGPPPPGQRFVYLLHPRPEHPSWQPLDLGPGKRNAPYIDGTATPRDKRVYGVFGGRASDDAYGSSFGVNSEPTYTVFALGEVWALVTDEGGNLTNGDFLTSSSTKYLAMRQADDLMHNYTFAKVLVDVDFTSVPVDPAFGVKVQRVPCTIHSG